ncbi:4-methylaminobutanoate oxidase (formaldehyde-forming) [Limimonas halophila]|uniref:4-methylaminobutanoate oxidase (Formaldehyde-forming) n=1 Tax=Limimonas halophila TaxID=1082479 RepID=A0A1G7LKS4_9PROT|nr:FAD-dependent oxidoreductase [Limimonas halophila]SDF49610.1 4-methylaminobutanoate oxidase (formaldehyde-forming) [Limimonas halophila]
MSTLPDQARTVIIGGGIVGCSTAYHLAKEGETDVVVLERGKLTCGSTFHAAGLVGQLRSNANITRLLKYSVELYERLEAETGLNSGWSRVGGLRLACNRERLTELKRGVTTARSFGVEVQMLSAAEAQKLWPMMATDGVMGAAFFPNDGHAQPSDLTQALAKGARQQGARILEDTPVKQIHTDGAGHVTGVETEHGTIRCERLVLCTGQWTREIGRGIGIDVPLHPMQHQYMVTEAVEGIERGIPTLRDPDGLVYFKEEVGGLVMGGYERSPLPWATDGIPPNFQFSLLDPDYEQFEPLIESGMERVPALQNAGVRQLINGPESFTPDGNFILGPAPEMHNVYVGAGFNAYGIAAGGGAGWALAAWIAGGEQPMDLGPVDIRRFGPPHRSEPWLRRRTVEETGKHYTISWPGEEHESARPARVSPVYERLRDAGACFGEKMGWERANWFATDGEAAEDRYTFGWPNWADAVAREHTACREGVALFDQSSFSKFVVSGPDAADAMAWICANKVAKGPGAVTYTQMLNPRGGIECDLTVSQIADDRFYVVTGTGAITHDFDWIKRSIPAGWDARIDDVTSAYGVLSLMGPSARDVLQQVTDDPVDGESFPFSTWRTLQIGGARVCALRVTYVGELGWELHIPMENVLPVFDALQAAGEPHGLTLAGYRAIESMRLEKGFRAWGSDVTPDETPLEAGLRFAVKLKSNTDFQGRAAIERQQREGIRKRFAIFTVDDPSVVLHGRETIYRDGEPVGYLTSAGYGHTIGAPIGFGYVHNDAGVDLEYLRAGTYELEVAMDRVPCTLHTRPLYDPEFARVKS